MVSLQFGFDFFTFQKKTQSGFFSEMDKGQEPYYETIPLSAFLCGLVHYAWLYNILRYKQPPIDASIETLPLLWSGPTGIFRPAEKKNAANIPPEFFL